MRDVGSLLESGDVVGARKAYPRAMEHARRAGDRPLQLRLLRLCRHFLEPDTACRHLEQAVELARETGLELERALCLNNLAAASAELGLCEVAAGHWRACRESLEAHGQRLTAVPLNNLGFLALTQGDLDDAGEVLGEAQRVAEGPVSLTVRSNLAVIRARRGLVEEAVRELKLLREESACPPAVLPAIRFNLARALLEAGRPEEALREAVAPPPWLANDEPLARAALAKLRLRAYRQAGRPVAEEGLHRETGLLEGAAQPQAWLYRTLWARGDVQFWEEAP